MKDKGKRSVDERYAQWKSLVPVLYDWLANHNLVWPSLSCRYLVLALVPRVSVFIYLSGAFPHCCVNFLFWMLVLRNACYTPLFFAKFFSICIFFGINKQLDCATVLDGGWWKSCNLLGSCGLFLLHFRSYSMHLCYSSNASWLKLDCFVLLVHVIAFFFS